MGKNNAKIFDIQTLIQAGINPVTGLPLKVDGFTSKKNLKPDLVRFLRIIDEQDAVNSGRWYNLPYGLSSQELERMLYYKGQLAFFYYPELDRFYFMPYALDGTIDFYGRYNTIHPVPYTSGKEEEKTVSYKKQSDFLSNIKLNCIYDVVLNEEEVTKDLLTKSCVLLHDYSKQMSQTILPRSLIQESIIDLEAEMLPLMRTNLIAGSGVRGVRVQDADQKDSVNEGVRQVESAALEGKIYIPIEGSIDFQEMSGSKNSSEEEYLLAMQSIDNLRLRGHGIQNGGIFEKKAHELQTEANINGGPIELEQQDRVSIRQHFCNVVNSIWGLGIWYEPSQNITQGDPEGDGFGYDRDLEMEGVEDNEM